MKDFSALALFFGLSLLTCAAASTPPEFTSPPAASTAIPLVGQNIIFTAAATDPQGLPLSFIFDYGDGTVDMLGSHVYTVPGAYTVLVTASNCVDNTTTSIPISIKGFSNLWIKKQSIKVGAAGKGSWQAQFIYNADRTSAGIFNSTEDAFLASLGTIPGIQINPAQFTRAQPKFMFKSAKGIAPSVTVTLDESKQTISLSAKAATFADIVPSVLSNRVQIGASAFALDAFFDAKGKFTANAGYKSAAFVVQSGTVKIKTAGKDSIKLSLLLGDPAFQFPGASGAKSVRVRMTDNAGKTIVDKDFTSLATFAKGKFKSGKDSATPAGKFSYDSSKGKMSAALSKATLAGLLKLPQEHIGVEVFLGDQTYSTHVTLFAPKTGSYSTKMGKGSGPVPGSTGAPLPTAPVIIAANPAHDAVGVFLNQKVTATFSEAMDASTITTASFTLQQGSTFLSGTVALAGMIATFTPDANFAANTMISASVTTAVKDSTGNAMLRSYVWCFNTGATADTTAPIVVSTQPPSAATNVAINNKISATFSEAMDPLTLNSTTFTVMQGATAVSGAVTYAAGNMTATFTPSTNLAPNTDFTATITTGAKDLAGNALAANFVWSFTTGATADSAAPSVISTNPTNNATNVAINHTVNATFNEAMDPATINNANFTLAGPGLITGTVTYDANNKIATFTSQGDLAPNNQFTANLTTGVKDLAGNAMASNFVWTFTTGTQRAQAPVPLGAIAPYGTFGGGSGMTNQGILTVINGDIGTTGASTTVTGFHDSVGDIYTETPLNKGQVNGRIYTAPPTPGGAGVGGNASTMAIATQAAADANTAYNNLSPASIPGGTDPGAGELGGLTLPPGVYKSAGATFQITGSDLTLDAQGDANAVWVFQMAASLTVGGPGAPRTVHLINGALPKNVFWQVGSAATINAAGGGTMVGTIIASSGVTFSTAGNVELVTLNGRAIGLNASTTLVNTVINVPAP